jgi:hypothetical protein
MRHEYGGNPPEGVKVNFIMLEDVVPPFDIGTLFPSTALIVTVKGGR